MLARALTVGVVAFALTSCGGGGDGAGGEPGPRSVTISWTANRESGVNRAGGGYQVSIGSQPAIDVPYSSGPVAPTSITVTLDPGTYLVTVRAYAALDSAGGASGSLSANSQALAVDVR